MTLRGTVSVLQQEYPDAAIVAARTAEGVQEKVTSLQPDLVVTDLCIPSMPGKMAETENGLQMLRDLMQLFPNLNIAVQSTFVKTLIRLKLAIDSHEGGFTVVDKSLTADEMLVKVGWALQGLIYTPKEIRAGLEVKPEWLDVLTLAFQEGLQDKAIAQQMQIAESTVRHYWSKIQNVLSVYPSAGKNTRIQTELRAREEGLID